MNASASPLPDREKCRPEKRTGWAVTTGAVALLSIAGMGRSANAQTEGVKLPVNRDALLAEMGSSVFDAVRRQDTDHAVFHGCIDWHSAVHGHWALLRIARTVHHDDERANWVHAALNHRGIALEAQLLRRNRRFEMPYGRAWFLRMAVEYELWMQENQIFDNSAIGPMADEVAASLLDRYTVRDATPMSREYGNDSWAFVQLYAFYQHRKDEERLRHLTRMIDEHFVNLSAPISFADDFARQEFFSRFGNWAYLMAKTRSQEQFSLFWDTHRPVNQALQPVIPQSAHHFGMNWSRAWALRAASRQTNDTDERVRLDTAFLRHVDAAMQTHQRSKNRYSSYGHWVPQFAVYALTE